VTRGRLPRLDATDEVALSPLVARHLGAGVGDRVTYSFHPGDGGAGTPATFTVVGLIRLPPVIVDENDILEGAVVSPAATHAHLGSFYFAWQGIRLDAGVGGIDRFVDQLASDPTVNQIPPVVQRYDITRDQVQRSVRPQAMALAVFGAAAAFAALALAGQTVARMIGSWSSDGGALRAAGFARPQLALASALDPAVALVLGTGLAVAVAVALSPRAPVGGVRAIAPDTGVHADLTVLLGGGGAVLGLLLVLAGVVAWRSARRDDVVRASVRSGAAARAGRWGLPVPMVVGTGFALDTSPSRGRAMSRLALAGGIAAVVAVAGAAVFGQSLDGLVSHPARYGWSWDRMLVAEAGYGNLRTTILDPAVAREPQITSWGTMAFGQGTVDGQPVPMLGLQPRRGTLTPPITEGRTVRTRSEVVVGRTTLRSLHRSVGDRIKVEVNGNAAELRIVGVAVLPSIGQGGADHPSLGRGLLLRFDALAELTAPGAACSAAEQGLCPQAMAFDVVPRADGAAVARRIAATDPDGVPAGTYEQPVTRAADIRNYEQMRSLPIALAMVLALAAMVAFGFALVGSVRVRRRDLAVLRAIGFTAGQLRTALVSQALVTAVVDAAIGLPLGIAAGRAEWIQFANGVGVVPLPVVQLPVFAGAVVLTLLASALVALVPARLAARATVGVLLRSE
jgi:hypothetical protein